MMTVRGSTCPTEGMGGGTPVNRGQTSGESSRKEKVFMVAHWTHKKGLADEQPLWGGGGGGGG